jgi:hypothetical protein
MPGERPGPSVDPRVFDQVWATILEIGAQERHFNELQSRYRSLASTWLLATFAAIGFVLSTQTLELPFPRELAVVGLALAGTAGIAMLWNLDVMVYHQLLSAAFAEGLRLERDHAWLPRVRANMMRTQNNRGVLPRVVGFYIGGVVVLLLIGGSALAIWLGQYGPAPAVGAVATSALVSGGLVRYIHRQTLGAGSVALERSLAAEPS